jgi:tetratricopeptide (TPR) repeat protein
MLKSLLLHGLLLLVPLLVVPWAVTFDASKVFLFALGAAVLAGTSIPRRSDAGLEKRVLRWSAPTLALGAAVILFLVAVFQATDLWAAAQMCTLMLSFAILALVFENVVHDSFELLPYLRTVAAAGALASAYGLAQAAGYDFSFPWRELHPRTPVSTLGNPNFAAEFVAACIPAQVLLMTRGSMSGKMGGGLALLLAAGLFFVTRGRTAMASLVLGGGLGLALHLHARGGRARHLGWALAGSLLLGAATLGAFVYGGDSLPTWLRAAGRTDTVLVRRDLARGTVAMVAANPMGVGPGNWAVAHPPHRTVEESRASLFRDPGEAHNEPLQFAAEGGWLFAIAAAAFVALLAMAAVRAVTTSDDAGLATTLAATAAIVLAAGLTSSTLHRPAMLVVLALSAGGIAFLGGKSWTGSPGWVGVAVQRLMALLLVAGTLHAGAVAMAEGSQSRARQVLRARSPLPPADAHRALDLLAASLFRDPGSTDSLARSGEVALMLGERESDPAARKALFEKALQRWRSLLVLRPLDPQVLSSVATAEAANGDDAAAEATWRRALEIVPHHRESNYGLGFHLLRRGRVDESLAFLDAALATDPGFGPAAGSRAEALTLLGREAEASEFLSDFVDRAARAEPPDLTALGEAARRGAAGSFLLSRMLLVKGTRLLREGNGDVGHALLVRLVDARPDEDLLEAAAIAYAEANRPAESLRLRVLARFAAAEALLVEGDRDGAAREARRALEVPLAAQNALEARVRVAAYLCRAGKREESIVELGVAVQRGWRDPATLLTDPAFLPLRGDPAFEVVVQRAAARPKE